MSLAVAVGFHKAQQLEAALPYAEAAATKLNTPAAHINLGDLLLSIAESQPDSAEAKALFAKAVEQYDIVLKAQPNSIEAVNNKAWILHSYLDRSREALDIVVALQKRVNPGRAALRVLRHSGRDPGVDRPDRERRAVVSRRTQEIARASDAQLPLRKDDRRPTAAVPRRRVAHLKNGRRERRTHEPADGQGGDQAGASIWRARRDRGRTERRRPSVCRSSQRAPLRSRPVCDGGDTADANRRVVPSARRCFFRLDRIAEICRKYDVVELSVFGSVLRDDFGPESDVDAMAVFKHDDYGPWMGKLQAMERELSELVGRQVDLVPKESVLRQRELDSQESHSRNGSGHLWSVMFRWRQDGPQ